MKGRTAQSVLGSALLHQIGSLFFVAGRAVSEQEAETAKSATSSLANEMVYGVRDAKNAFSRLLNEAAMGAPKFIETGSGETVAIVAVRTLGEAAASMDRRNAMTLEDAILALPYSRSELPPLRLRGGRPGRGLLRTASAAAPEDADVTQTPVG